MHELDRIFETRKKDHLRLALSDEHQATGLHGLDSVRLLHDSLPEIDFDDVGLTGQRFGRVSETPFYIAGMTAGHESARLLNRRLASAAAGRGWAFGVGSQRRELDALESTVDKWLTIREDFPDLTLIANLGAFQLNVFSVKQVSRLVENLGAQAIAIHLNPLQECLQTEGTPDFRGVLDSLRSLTEELPIPVVVKETGCGMSESTLRKLSVTGVAAVDVSGLGGTHWGRIEGARALERNDRLRAQAAIAFADWGEPTAISTVRARRLLPEVEVWASGGVRNGVDAAKLIALGAAQIGFARPALIAATESEEALDRWMAQQEFELRVALFCTGCRTPDELRDRDDVVSFRLV